MLSVSNQNSLKYSSLFFAASILIAASGPATPEATPQLVNVYASSAAYPWLVDMYNCAPSSTALSITDPQSAEISLRLGQSPVPTGPAFQIGTEDLLVVAHSGSGVVSLGIDQVQSLFSGRVSNWKEIGGSDLTVEVWTFSPESDIEGIFDRIVMKGEPVSSLARLAVSVQAMSYALGAVPGTVGVLPRRQKNPAVQELFTVSALPVLAMTKSEPQGIIKDLLTCAQSGK